MKATIKYITGLMAFFFFLASSILAQDNVTGTVYNENGVPIPGITVNLVETGMSSITSSEGVFYFSGISDPYCEQFLTLQIILPGYFGTSVEYYESCNGGTQTVNIFLVLDRAPIMVTNTDDSGPGSLRQAILDANSSTGKDYIHFNIPDYWKSFIQPLSPLNPITDEVVINGFSQPGSEMNTNPAGTGFNTRSQVVIDGGGTGVGLNITTANNCEIKGLILNQCNIGISISGDDNIVRECFIGTDTLGSVSPANGNVTYGVRILGASNEITNCVISGNGAPALSPDILIGDGSADNLIYGNLIGTDLTGTIPTPNTASGIIIRNSSGNIIGGLTDSERNVIFGGIQLLQALTTGNMIQGNYVGPDVSGVIDLGSGGGIKVSDGANGNEIGPDNVISGIPVNGITITGSTTHHNVVIGNYFGVAADGNTPMPNESGNVVILNAPDNQVGGPSADLANVISGASNHGITISGPTAARNQIIGNFIGTNAAGDQPIGNTLEGIHLLQSGPDNVIGPGNLISGNGRNAIYIDLQADYTTIRENLIGTDYTGSSLIGNQGNGVIISQSSNNTVQGNTICGAGSWSSGVTVSSVGTTNNTIIGNYIGTNASGQPGLGNSQAGITISYAVGTIVENNVISGNGFHGISLENSGTSQTSIISNKIGTNVTGDAALENGQNGVQIINAPNNTIGPGNVISGNGSHGIRVSGVSGIENKIIGNFVGTNASGTGAIPNMFGITIWEVDGTIIGGTEIADRNIISGNVNYGINTTQSATNTRIMGNFIGTDVSGDLPIPNGAGISCSQNSTGNYIGTGNGGAGNLIAFNSTGISISTTDSYIQGNVFHDNNNGISLMGNNNTVGGADPQYKNYFYRNTINGVSLSGNSLNNRIEGNQFGLDQAGLLDQTDGVGGIRIDGSDHIIMDNLISGYSEYGIRIGRAETNSTINSGNLISGNRIGVNATGDAYIPNGHGIIISRTTDNVLVGNLIAGNSGNGIQMFDAATINNQFTSNSIYDNGELGIDLNRDGVSENDIDPLDADEGPNHLQNFPDLESISYGKGTVRVTGTLRSGASSTYTLEFFSSNTGDPSTYGEGEFYLGSYTVETDENGDGPFDCILPLLLNGGQLITATATDGDGNSSEFSQVNGRAPLMVINTDDSGPGSLRQAILDANANQGKDYIYFNIPGSSVHTIRPLSILPTISDSVFINGFTQPGSMWNTNEPHLGFNTEIRIELDGSHPGNPGTGLIVNTDNCEISGLTINRFSNRGIAIWGNKNSVDECFIGTDAQGSQNSAFGNGVYGIEIFEANSNQIRNCIISSNGGAEQNPGLILSGGSTQNLIAGNLIGTDITGTSPLPNSGSGINISDSPENTIGGLNDERNVIYDGLQIGGEPSTGNQIIGNYFGPDVSGLDPVDQGRGIVIGGGANDNEIGPDNIISANGNNGILLIDPNTSKNRVFGNIFGLAADGITPMGNGSSNIVIENASNNRIGGLTPDSLNVVSACQNDAGIAIWGENANRNNVVGNYIGTNAAGDQPAGNAQQGILISAEASNNVIGPNNVISCNGNWGIQIHHPTATGNRVINNFIGTDHTGTQSMDVLQAGVYITNSPGNIVDGNTICGTGSGSGVPHTGITLLGVDTRGTIISNNYIGTNANGVQGLGFASSGIMVFMGANSNEIGPSNVISGNGGGFQVEGEGTDNNRVFGNYIGTNQSSSSEIGNVNTGIYVALGARNTVIGPDNIISNNDNGIHIENETTTETTIIGNYIGTNVDGTAGLGNSNIGVWIGGSPNNVIGGTNLADRNIISGNGSDGILLFDFTAVGNEVYGNYIGTDVTGNTSIKNGSVGIAINDASNSIIGGLEPGAGNIVSDIGIGNSGATGNHIIGNYIGINADGDQALDPGKGNAGVMIGDASENVIGPGNVLSGNQEGIYISSADYINPDNTVHNMVIGNLIGTNAEGNAPIPNQQGILVEGALETIIGGPMDGERNIISGNLYEGIAIRGLNLKTRVFNNYIGSDLTGKIAIPNDMGIKINSPSTETYIGGGEGSIGNLIAFNHSVGIGVDAHQNYFQGNVIHSNNGNAIYITGNQNAIGGPADDDRNYIYGNDGGISIFYNSNQNLVEGNILGTDPEGVEDKTDSWDGIAISGNDNIVRDNLVSGYENQGILITRWSPDEHIPQRNRIEQNRIGLALNGDGYIPNGHGISLNSTTDNIIIENVVAGNNWNGIALRDDHEAVSLNNLISQNSLYDNGGIGIDLISDWVTENDPGPLDPDEGPNHLQNFPELDSIKFGEGSVTVGGVLRSEASRTYTLEFFSSNSGNPSNYGEGEYYLGSETVQTDGNGNAFFNVTLPSVGYGAQVITATATDEDGNTSEFSQVIGGAINQVWASMPFRYTLNSDGLPTVPLEDYQNAIREAFATWNSVLTAAIEMEEAGSSSARYASASDGLNLVSFQDDHFPFAKGVLAVTAKTLRMTSGGTAAEILDADIIFNPDYIHDPYHPFAVLAEGDSVSQAFDIQSVATHEIGHGLGMIHSGVFSSSMYFMLGLGTSERSLDLDDGAWASYRYPNEDFQPNHALISGRVTYGDLGDPDVPSTHPPVAGALVLAVNTLSQDMIHAYTDADGNYTVPVPMQGSASADYYIYIQPLDGDVYGTPLQPANISPYVYSHAMFTDFPEEFYNENDGPYEDRDENSVITVIAGNVVKGIDLITNRDETAPVVLEVYPEDGETGISFTPTLLVKFSEPVDKYSFDENTCYLENSGETVEGDFTILADSTHIMLMKPVEALQYSTSYTLHIDAITDLKGNAMETPYTSSFTTRAPDTDPPAVNDVIPADGTTQVDVTKPVKVFFSEPMNKSSVETGFQLTTSDHESVEGTFSWDVANKEMTYLPDYSMQEGTDYIFSLSTLVTDLSGNALEQDEEFTFSTIEVAAPQIIYLGPADGSTGITVETPVAVKVSEPLDVSTITPGSFSLTGPLGQVGGIYEYLDDNRTIIFRPDKPLAFDQDYTIILTGDISDKSSPRQYLSYTEVSFRTATEVSTPHIVSMNPPFGAVGSQTSILGYGFDPDPLNNVVTFNGFEARVTKATLESVTVEVPQNAFDGPVTVVSNGVVSDNTFLFDVVPPNTDPSYSVIASATTGSRTRSVVINPDAGYAYVTNWGDNTVTAINLNDGNLDPVIDIPVGIEPMDIDLNPDGTLAYVTNYLSNTVSVIGTDLANTDSLHQVVNEIPVGYHPYGVAVSSDKKVYVANNESEYVSVIDVDPNSGGFDHVIANLKTGTTNRSIVVTPDAALVLVSGDNGVIILDRDPQSPTFNQVIANASAGSTTRHITITPDAALALATTDDGLILIIDIFQPPGVQFGSVIASVKTGTTARNITISPDAMYVYITNPDENTVTVYKLDYSIIPGYGASLNNPLGLVYVTTVEVDDVPYAIAGHPSGEYLLVTHDSEEGGVSKIGVSEESIDPILTLGQLIASVRNALEQELIPPRDGARLLEDLEIVRDRINEGQLASALDNINTFIRRLERFMSRGNVPEDLGNAWLEAAYRIRDQIERDMEVQDQLKGSGIAASGSGSTDDQQDLANRAMDPERSGTLYLENRPNPFGDHTLINFVIPENGEASVPVSMKVYNTSGQVIKNLVQMHMAPGRYSVLWNGDQDQGGHLSNGIYLLELTVPGQRKTITISVMR